MVGDVTKEIFVALRAHLLTKCPSFKEIYDNWPNPNQKLLFPCGTVFMGKPRFNPLDPYVVSKGVKITTGPDTGKFPVVRVVGDHEFKFQFDIWCESKPQRHQVWTEFFNGFNSNIAVMGLSLQLTNYFNEWVHYSIDDYEFVDTEEGSQRSEWRIRVSILADCKAIISKNENLIETIENKLEIPESAIVPPEPSDSVDIII